jgi:hypothetical protein
MNYLIYERKIRIKKNIEHIFSIPVRINPAYCEFQVNLDNPDQFQSPPAMSFILKGIESQKCIIIDFPLKSQKAVRSLSELTADVYEDCMLEGCVASELLFFTLTVQGKN